VDLVITDPYSWTEIESNSIDLLVSGQTFEHIEYFWVTMFEIGRVLKPGGVAVLIAPSSGFEHRYPVDCWRFYRDGFAALSKMINFKLLESFTDWGRSGDAIWADSIGIFQKPLWSEEESLAFKSKYAAAHEILPLGFNSTPLNEMHLTAEVSTLESLGSGRLTSDLEKIRTEDISQDLPIVTRLRLALGIVLEKKNVSLVNQLLRRTSKGSENSWGTNTNMLND
jgi:SAM-dependent methyltransferase